MTEDGVRTELVETVRVEPGVCGARACVSGVLTIQWGDGGASLGVY